MSYPVYGPGGQYNGGMCPPTHPKAIYSVFYEFFFDTSAFQDWQNLIYSMGDVTGYGLHGDYL